MSNWLKNIQGQLTDLANEVLSEANDVLNEAREEVADPDTELQVAKKKAAEAEKQLAIETAKVKSLEDEKKSLEQQLYDAHVEMDTIDAKFGLMIKQRDEEIKKLKVQIEQINESGWNSSQNASEEDQISDLKKEIQHWKSVVDSNKDTISKVEFEKKMDEARQKKEHEIQTLIESHADSIVELREMYEEKLQSLQVMQYNASSSTSNADVLDAVLLEKEELLSPEGSITNAKKKSHQDEMCRSKASTNEDGVVVELRDDLSDEKMRQLEEELELCKEQKIKIIEENSQMMENLKDQNRELAQAYNDLNEEFETFKRENAVVEVRNADLNNRIDSLKANLIEYEERYELAKRENMDTVAQLEKLSQDFERLRSGIANVSQRRENCDTMVNEEVEKLRNALDESRAERERLRADVHRFQEAVSEIDVELEKLRESNHKLLQENVALTNTVSTYDSTMKDIISNSEKDIGEFREQFRSIQESHRTECDRVLAEINGLRDENSSLKRQNEYMTEETKLLREVNEKLKAKSETEDTKGELLEKKIELLEHLRNELSNDVDEKRAEIAELKKQLEEQKPEQEVSNNESEQEAAQPEETSKIEENVGQFANNTEMLEAQLSEALKANTEKSEECEELRNAARNLEREVEIRQNCVDEMITQTNSLQIQQQILTKENSDLSNEILTRERDYLRLEQKLVHEQEKTEELKTTVQNLEKCILGKSKSEDGNSTSEESAEAMKLYIDQLKKKYDEQQEELEILRADFTEKNEQSECVQRKLKQELREAEEVDRGLLEGIEIRVSAMEEDLAEKTRLLEESREFGKRLQEELEAKKVNENNSAGNEEELKKALMQKHEESVEYYRQLEACIARNQVLEQQVGELQKSAEKMNGKLRSDADQFEKRGRELERLKEHLMIVEENSTREAVEAEHRETELRKRVRELEATGMAVKEGASETTQQLQINIASLTAKLESVERSENEWKRKFEAELKAREQTAEALTSLQTVVHELSIDHERDTASASHRNLELQTDIKSLKDEIEQLREDLDRQMIGKQASEEEVERMVLQLDAKQKIIEELENQIEELRAPTASKAQQDSYRVDDQTLRQLFLNYFMAEPSKRADIAMLLASILEYPSEEMEKFRNAVKQSFGQTSSFFGLTGSSPQQGKSSLTEQFIRFLEVESESSKTAPHLPVRAPKNETPHKISMDTANQNSSTSSSSAALDSLLR